jgi:hypothetical protein
VDTGIVDLLPGERLLWEGSPVRHRLFRPADGLLVPFSIVWCGLVVVAVASVLPPEILFFPPWGVPFALIGLYLIVGRFIVRAVASRRTRYAITDRRVLIVVEWFGDRLKSYYLSALPPPVITERQDGSGNLAFGAFPGVRNGFGRRNGWRAWGAEPTSSPVLWDILEVRSVRDLVANSQST